MTEKKSKMSYASFHTAKNFYSLQNSLRFVGVFFQFNSVALHFM